MTAESSEGTAAAVVVEETEDDKEDKRSEGPEQVHLTLRAAEKDGKKVTWTEETVDNEHLGRKKSKCCCIYVKPRRGIPGDDESSEDERDGDDCEHCPGHHGKDLNSDKGGASA